MYLNDLCPAIFNINFKLPCNCLHWRSVSKRIIKFKHYGARDFKLLFLQVRKLRPNTNEVTWPVCSILSLFFFL